MRSQLFRHILLIVISVTNSNGQNKFERIYGGAYYDYGYSITTTSDKGYALVGSTSSFGSGSTDGYLLKIDSLGAPLWQKEFGGINIDQLYSVCETADSGFAATGFSNSYGTNGYDMFIVRTNTSGDTLWTKKLGGNNWDFGYSIKQTSDGGYIVAGGTYSFGSGSEDMYLVKLNSNGDTTWTRTYGGSNDDEAKSVIQTSDGGYLLTGYTKSYGNINGDVFSVRTNSFGDTIWTKKLGYSGSDVGNSIKETSTGELIIAGSTQLSSGINQAFIIKMNSLGDTIFTRQYGYPNDAAAFDICEASDGGYTWTGKLKIGTRYNVYFFKVDAGGNYNFAFTYGGTNGDDEGRSIQLTSDNGFVVAGNSNSFNTGLGDAYVFKTDNSGYSSGTIVNNVIGIEEINYKAGTFVIYPNPASNSLTLDIHDDAFNASDAEILIYDLLGKIRYHNNIITKKIFTLDISDLENGIYLVRLISKNSSAVIKLVIKH